MIQDLKNDFKNDRPMRYKHSDNNNNINKMIIYCSRNILNTSCRLNSNVSLTIL